MFLSQLRRPSGRVQPVFRDETGAHAIPGAGSSYELVQEAIATGRSLIEVIRARGKGEAVDLEAAAKGGELLPPINHPDPAHMHVTGTGLTHLGSAAARDAMHAKLASGEEELTDSMKMFCMGLEGGRPPAGAIGVQPEWFYKGSGHSVVAPGAPLLAPGFALDGGEEPELAGIYVIAPDGRPCRIGFALGNEFSDHVTERVNYLWLAHSKLRPSAFGPEIRLGPCPEDVRGTSRILRDGAVIWEKPFLSGEANMSHSLANLEHHHFKYAPFRCPGDLHIHMFGTATLSFADGITPRQGDVFEISSPDFGLPLRNALAFARDEGLVSVHPI